MIKKYVGWNLRTLAEFVVLYLMFQAGPSWTTILNWIPQETVKLKSDVTSALLMAGCPVSHNFQPTFLPHPNQHTVHINFSH